MNASSEGAAVRPLRRSSDDRVVAGVAAGLARYFGLDPIVVRIAFVVFAVLPPVPGALIYLVAWALIPSDGSTPASRGKAPAAMAAVVGALLVALGALLTVELAEPSWIDARYVGPALLVVLGAAIFARGVRE